MNCFGPSIVKRLCFLNYYYIGASERRCGSMKRRVYPEETETCKRDCSFRFDRHIFKWSSNVLLVHIILF